MAKGNSGLNLLSGWAFLAGVALAVVLGFLGGASGYWVWVLVLIGIIVGLLNVAGREVTPFLMSGAVLIIASAFGSELMSSVQYLGPIFDALLAVFVPATVVVAIKNAFMLARN